MSTEYNVWCAICGFRHNRPTGQTEHAREKACDACGRTKSLTDFSPNSGSHDGHYRVCKACRGVDKAQKGAKAAAEATATSVSAREAHPTRARYGAFAEMTVGQVARWARGALKLPTLCIVDTETTGRGPKWGGGVDEIVEICIIDGSGVVLLNTLVRPRGTMHPDAAAKSGITDAMLATCAPFSAIAKQVRGYLDGKHVVIYNAEYDTGLIAGEFAACSQAAPTYEVRCAMLAYHKFSGRPSQQRWARLDAACQTEGITPQGDAHRALGDCLSTLALLRRMAERAPTQIAH